MKATLEFNLPDEDYAFKCACKATELASVLRDLDNDMRNIIKHVGVENLTDASLERWRMQINETIQGIEV